MRPHIVAGHIVIPFGLDWFWRRRQDDRRDAFPDRLHELFTASHHLGGIDWITLNEFHHMIIVADEDAERALLCAAAFHLILHLRLISRDNNGIDRLPTAYVLAFYWAI